MDPNPNSYIGVSGLYGVVNNIVVESKMFMNEVVNEVADVHIDGGRPWCERWVLNPNAMQWAMLTPGVDYDPSKRCFHTMFCIPLYDGDRKVPVGVLQLGDKVEMDERQFRKTFDRFDADHSGAIDFGELRLAFADLGVDADEEDIRTMLEVIQLGDENERDIEVTYEQFTFMLLESLAQDEALMKSRAECVVVSDSEEEDELDEEAIPKSDQSATQEASDESAAGKTGKVDGEEEKDETEGSKKSKSRSEMSLEEKAAKRLKMRMKFQEKSTSTCFTKHDETVVAAMCSTGFGVVRNMLKHEEAKSTEADTCRLQKLAEICQPSIASSVHSGAPISSFDGNLLAKEITEAFEVELVTIWKFSSIQGREEDDTYSHTLERLGIHHSPCVVDADNEKPQIACTKAIENLYGPHRLQDPKRASISRGGSRSGGPRIENATEIIPDVIFLDDKHPSGVLGNTVLHTKKMLVTKLMVTDKEGHVFDPEGYYDVKVDAAPGFSASDVMCIPLMKGTDVMGAIQFVNRKPRKSFDVACQANASLAAMWVKMILFEEWHNNDVADTSNTLSIEQDDALEEHASQNETISADAIPNAADLLESESGRNADILSSSMPPPPVDWLADGTVGDVELSEDAFQFEPNDV